MISIKVNEVDARAFNEAVNNIVATSKRDLRVVINQQAKLLATQFMHYTPPFAGGNIPSAGSGGSTKADHKAGVEAVKRDILRTMTPPSELFRNGFTSKQLEKIVKKKDKKRLQDYFDNVKSPKLRGYKVVDFDPLLHLKNRVRGNRFRPSNQQKFVFEEREVKRYIKDVQKRVGSMKAGWGVAINKFGGSMPAWVRNQLGHAKGTAEVLRDEPTSYTVEMSNYTPAVARFSSNYNVAIRIRTNALVRQYQDYLQKTVQNALRK